MPYHCDRHGRCRTSKVGSRRCCALCFANVEFRPLDVLKEAAKISAKWSEFERHKRAGLKPPGAVEIQNVDDSDWGLKGSE